MDVAYCHGTHFSFMRHCLHVAMASLANSNVGVGILDCKIQLYRIATKNYIYIFFRTFFGPTKKWVFVLF